MSNEKKDNTNKMRQWTIVSNLGNGLFAVTTQEAYMPGVGLASMAYKNKKVVGDLNDPTKIEAIQCLRCKKWIPVQALLDYERSINTENKVHDCPVGRSGKGGIHLYDFGILSKPSFTVTMLPVKSVEPYKKDNDKE